jgi:hypothetical protein
LAARKAEIGIICVDLFLPSVMSAPVQSGE